ncbi:MAG: hypothetical protein IJ565_06605 [Bacilli bacterium]|nr:hypothetical protein [Bacilli bacterium]
MRKKILYFAFMLIAFIGFNGGVKATTCYYSLNKGGADQINVKIVDGAVSIEQYRLNRGKGEIGWCSINTGMDAYSDCGQVYFPNSSNKSQTIVVRTWTNFNVGSSCPSQIYYDYENTDDYGKVFALSQNKDTSRGVSYEAASVSESEVSIGGSSSSTTNNTSSNNCTYSVKVSDATIKVEVERNSNKELTKACVTGSDSARKCVNAGANDRDVEVNVGGRTRIVSVNDIIGWASEWSGTCPSDLNYGVDTNGNILLYSKQHTSHEAGTIENNSDGTPIGDINAGTTVSDCEGLIGPNVLKFLKLILRFVRIVGPILALVLGMYDLMMAMAKGEEDDRKKAIKKLKGRIIAAVLLLLLPYLLDIFLDLVGKGGTNCVS